MDLVAFFGRFHVLVLHLPIGILLMAACLEMLCAFSNKQRPVLLNQVWAWGAVSAIGACTLGYMLSLSGGYDIDAVEVHKKWGIGVAVFSCVCFLYFFLVKKHSSIFIYPLALIQLFILFTTGHYGANMTHGEEYLFEYAPNTLRVVAGFPKREKPRPEITNINDADIFLDLVKPVLANHCYGCHNNSKQKGGLNLSAYEGIMAGGKSGAAVTALSLKDSEVYTRITLPSHKKEFMPANGKPPLSEEQINIIKLWIQTGALSSGLLSSLVVDKQTENEIAQYLGLNNSWSLPAIEPISDEQRVNLENHGFIVKFISQDINYIDLDLSSSNKPLTDALWSSILSVSANVASVNFSGKNLDDSHMQYFEKLTNLVELKLERNHITANGVSVLSQLPNLKVLNVFSNKIDDGLFDVLPNFKSLHYLTLSLNLISQAALDQYKSSNGLLKSDAALNIINFQAPEPVVAE